MREELWASVAIRARRFHRLSFPCELWRTTAGQAELHACDPCRENPKPQTPTSAKNPASRFLYKPFFCSLLFLSSLTKHVFSLSLWPLARGRGRNCIVLGDGNLGFTVVSKCVVLLGYFDEGLQTRRGYTRVRSCGHL
jgi:hypothetical protein